MDLRIVNCPLTPLRIDVIAQAYHLPGEDRVVVLCELSNTGRVVIPGAAVTAVGYANEGWITAMAHAGPWCMQPDELRPVELIMRPLGFPIKAVRLFPHIQTCCR